MVKMEGGGRRDGRGNKDLMPKDTGRKLELGVGWLGLEVDGNGSDYQGIAEMTWVIEQHDKLRWAGGGGAEGRKEGHTGTL